MIPKYYLELNKSSFRRVEQVGVLIETEGPTKRRGLCKNLSRGVQGVFMNDPKNNLKVLIQLVHPV